MMRVDNVSIITEPRVRKIAEKVPTGGINRKEGYQSSVNRL